MPNRAELSIDQLGAALAEKIRSDPNLVQTSALVQMINGKPYGEGKQRHTLKLSPGEKRTLLTALDTFFNDVAGIDPKIAIRSVYESLAQEHRADIPVAVFPTPVKTDKPMSLVSASFRELNALWVDKQPIR